MGWGEEEEMATGFGFVQSRIRGNRRMTTVVEVIVIAMFVNAA
jgi:hypothetical protein